MKMRSMSMFIMNKMNVYIKWAVASEREDEE